MKVVGYAYPWDVAEPGFMDRVRSAGIDEVAVATSYHSTRAATPWSTTSTAVDASHAALYRPQRDEAWAGRRLRPGTPSWLSDPDPAGALAPALTAARSAADLPVVVALIGTEADPQGWSRQADALAGAGAAVFASNSAATGPFFVSDRKHRSKRERST